MRAFEDWKKTNVAKHRAPGYAIATISLKTVGQIPGDASADQMDMIADLMDGVTTAWAKCAGQP